MKLWEELPWGGMCKALWGHRAKKNPFSLGGIREGFVKVGNGCWSAPREGESRTGGEDRGRSPSSSGVHELGARLPGFQSQPHHLVALWTHST